MPTSHCMYLIYDRGQLVETTVNCDGVYSLLTFNEVGSHWEARPQPSPGGAPFPESNVYHIFLTHDSPIVRIA